MRPLNRAFALGGDQQNPRYQVTHILGQGGMGTVFKANDYRLRREVAIKAMNLDGADEQDAARFRMEARTLANLQHPHIMGVSDFFEGYLHNEGRPTPHYFYAMDFQPGMMPLDEIISRSGHLTNENALRLIEQVGSALVYCHENDVIHRDLKPAQILVQLDQQGKLVNSKLSDFGLVKLLKKAQDKGLQSVKSLTLEGDILGTPVYMPPEQATGGKIRKEADVYGWAATVYNAMSGQVPLDFSHIQPSAIGYLTHIISYADGKVGIQPITQFRPDLKDTKADMYFEKALHPDPQQRMPSINIFNNAMRQVLSPEEEKPRYEKRRKKQVQAPSRRRFLMAMGGALGAAALGGLALFSGSDEKRPVENPTQPTEPKPQPRVEVIESGLEYSINGDFNVASIHQYLPREGRFVASETGALLEKERGTKIKLDPGRYQIKVVHDDRKTFYVPLKIEEGKTASQQIWIPTFDPNTFRSQDNRPLTIQPWRYITVDDHGKDKSFWRLDAWTLLDHAAFTEKGVYAPNKERLAHMVLNKMEQEGTRRAPRETILAEIKTNIDQHMSDPTRRTANNYYGSLWHEVMFRNPSHATATESYFNGVHAQPFMHLNNGKVELDATRTRQSMQNMGALPLTNIKRGSAQDPLNTSNAFAYSLGKEMSRHIGGNYMIKLPSEEQLYRAMTGGPKGSPLFSHIDRDGQNNTHLAYVQQVQDNDFEALRPINDSIRSPYGVPLGYGAPRWYTDLVQKIGELEKFYSVGMEASGVTTQMHTDPNKRSALIGVSYVIEKVE